MPSSHHTAGGLAIATDDEHVLVLDGVTGERVGALSGAQWQRPERRVGRQDHGGCGPLVATGLLSRST